MSRDDGIKLVAIYHFVTAAIIMMVALFILLLPFLAVLGAADPRGTVVVLILMGGLFVFLSLFAGLYLVSAIGLWQRREWARWATIVLSVLGLFNFPIGTVIGLASLWLLLRDDVQDEFRTRE